MNTHLRCREGEYRREVLGRDAGIVRQHVLDGVAAGERSENLRDQDAGSAHNGLAVADLGIDLNPVIQRIHGFIPIMKMTSLYQNSEDLCGGRKTGLAIASGYGKMC